MEILIFSVLFNRIFFYVTYRDVYSLQSGPQQLEFGHVFEDPNVWEQRYEKKDFDAQRYQGKVSSVFFFKVTIYYSTRRMFIMCCDLTGEMG